MSKRPKCYQGYGRKFARIIGLQLRLIRYERNLSLEQVEQDNDIKAGQLENIELGLMPSCARMKSCSCIMDMNLNLSH